MSIFHTDDFVQRWNTDKSREKSSIDIATHFLTELKPFIDNTSNNRSLRMMDFGCGSGEITTLFAPYVSSIVAVDTSDKMLSVLRDNLQRNNEQETLQNVVEPVQMNLLDDNDQNVTQFKANQRFDIIICSRVLIFVKDVEKIVNTFYQLLNEGGIVVCTELQSSDTAHQFFSEQTRRELSYVGLREDQLSTWFTDAGFSNISFRVWLNEKQNRVTKEVEQFPFILCSALKISSQKD